MLVVFSMIDQVRQLVDSISHNFTKFSNSLFHYTAKKNAQKLLNSGLPLNQATNRRGFTILLTSVHQEDMETVSFLLERGASVNCRSVYEGWTPLHLAAMSCCDRDDIADLLLSKGADVNARDYAGTTPLHQACNVNNLRIIALLVRGGAAIDALDAFDETPFSLLRPELEFYDECAGVAIKEFAKLVVLDRKSGHGLILLLQDRGLLEFYISCVKELAHLGMTKFYGGYSYLSVLRMGARKLAKVTKRKEFLAQFERNLAFPLYGDELWWIVHEAVGLRNKSDVVFSRISEVFGDHFPDVVTRKLADNVAFEDVSFQ